MSDKKLTSKSKFLSLVLRHQPDAAGVTLDENGWVAVDVLLLGCLKAGKSITPWELREIVRTSDKQRFALSDDGLRIRANQGHSVEVELGYEPAVPPAKLYHGTAKQFVEAIRRDGLSKKQRHDVHLTEDIEMTMRVAQRRGVPALVTIDSAAMHADGIVFYKTPNNVWLTDHVPAKYLVIDDEKGR